ncbi:hypothetical protein [Microbacterium sp. No. 7]|uniref:hypothetical protein n=1 Tax=Microbacterium sp. No. 7 TaxID=1714373 RepID=UPI0006D11EDE|nr:hypothetical protein [Microbacterium sp. No. 7]ALJ19384.1 hypothetical protein AOA12_05480 [Microbacterium sp. No. 7]
MRVLHFNDCAFVAATLVAEARAQGLDWRHLTPDLVRPRTQPRGGLDRLRYLPYVARRIRAVGASDIVHVHYGTSASLLRQRGVPHRPYVLSLHGTDIRTQWHDPRFHDQLRRAIDEAAVVLYTNLDTAETTLQARPDARHLPQAVSPHGLPQWRPRGRETGTPRIVFAPRWSADKGVDAQLGLAADLHRALPHVELVGLDWGEGAKDAERAGVRLVPTMPHEAYLDLLATADLVIGQADVILSVSDFEAMLIGAPVAALGERLPSEDGTQPPTLRGSRDEVVAQVAASIGDPAATAERLGARAWVIAHHDPAQLVPMLETIYRQHV